MIEVKHLSRSYGSRKVLWDLNFKAETGRIYGFLGPNGAGKSTTMNIMTGYLAAGGGEVMVNGCDIGREPVKAKRHIGYLPETAPLYQDMTVREYLHFAGRLHGMSVGDTGAAVREFMDSMHLQDVGQRLIRNLSKGYKQRVGFAAAVLHRPENIILDEPTSGLDPEQQKEMFDYLRSIKAGHTIIISSHILSDIAAVCDRVWIMGGGRLLASGSPEELGSGSSKPVYEVEIQGDRDGVIAALRQMPHVVSAAGNEDGGILVKTDTGEDLRAEISWQVFAQGAALLSVTRKSESLEEVFLELTKEVGE